MSLIPPGLRELQLESNRRRSKMIGQLEEAYLKGYNHWGEFYTSTGGSSVLEAEYGSTGPIQQRKSIVENQKQLLVEQLVSRDVRVLPHPQYNPDDVSFRTKRNKKGTAGSTMVFKRYERLSVDQPPPEVVNYYDKKLLTTPMPPAIAATFGIKLGPSEPHYTGTVEERLVQRLVQLLISPVTRKQAAAILNDNWIINLKQVNK